MRSNYNRIGNFIKEVDVRNKDLKVSTLLGLSITKEFIPSVANTVGTNMANYKVIKKGQFACSLMQVRRDKKLPVALLKNYDEAIISQAYPVFEISRQDELLPEYLMMWMARSEFDRYACFLAVGGVRGSLEWDDFCDMTLPVPHPDKQREIVREYNTIVERIKLNEQLNQKLEETAQALYKHWFVDFEFPISKEYAESVGKPELEGRTFKSNSGKMSWNEELDKELPECWGCSRLDKFASIRAGGDKPEAFSNEKSDDYQIPIYSNSTDNEGLYGYTNRAKIEKKSITVSARGAIIGYTVLRLESFFPIVRLIVVTPINERLLNFLFESIKKFRYDDGASAQGQLTVPDISSFKLVEPNPELLLIFQNITSKIIGMIEVKKLQNKVLGKLLLVLHSKMSMA